MVSRYRSALSAVFFIAAVHTSQAIANDDPDETSDKQDVSEDIDAAASLASDSANVAGELAKEMGGKFPGQIAGGTSSAIDILRVGEKIRNGDVPGAVGVAVSNAGGRIVVPICAAAGGFLGGGAGLATGGSTSIPLGIAGFAGGAALCHLLVNNTGKQAEQLTKDAIEKAARVASMFEDPRSDFQKRIDELGLDTSAIADKYDFGAPGQREAYLNEVLEQLEILHVENFRQQGGEYLPDPFFDKMRQTLGLDGLEMNIASECGPLNDMEKQWILNNADPELENKLASMKAHRKNILNWTTNGHFQPDIDLERRLLKQLETDIADSTKLARSELGSCPDNTRNNANQQATLNECRPLTQVDELKVKRTVEDVYGILFSTKKHYENQLSDPYVNVPATKRKIVQIEGQIRDAYEYTRKQQMIENGCTLEAVEAYTTGNAHSSAHTATIEESSPASQDTPENTRTDDSSKSYNSKGPKIWLDSGPLLKKN